VFWLPEEDTGTVILIPQPPFLPPDNRLPVFHSVLSAGKTSEQSLHVLHELANGQRVHLALPPDAQAGHPLVAVIPLDVSGFDRIEAITRLLASLFGRAIPSDTRMTAQQRARARRMLQATDGHHDGASQQEIAEVIFRLRRLSRDEWQEAPERYATMDLIKDGLAMIAGGYRKLLRHRRRS
jgi:hypothetical protein